MTIARVLLATAALGMMVSGCRSSETSSPPPPPVAPSSSTPTETSNSSTRTREIAIHVEGLTCEGCAWQIRETLQKVDDISDVRTTVADERVVVTLDPHRVTSATVIQALEQVGYESEEAPR